MGSPKQLLKWGNDTLLNHAIKTVLEIDAYEVIVVLGANHKLIEAGVKHRSITILNNEDWDLGLGKSIACATEYVLKSKPQVEGILITLADQPLIDSHYLNDIMTHFYQDLNQIIATSYDNNKGVPVLFGKVYFQELSNLTGDNGAKQLLKTHESCVKTFKPPVKNVDLDSKEDYEKLYRENFKTK